MLLDTRYTDAKRVTLVQDNLNTHTKGAFYEVFEPPAARAHARRINGVYPPKHGSWLDVAECGLQRYKDDATPRVSVSSCCKPRRF